MGKGGEGAGLTVLEGNQLGEDCQSERNGARGARGYLDVPRG